MQAHAKYFEHLTNNKIFCCEHRKTDHDYSEIYKGFYDSDNRGHSVYAKKSSRAFQD